MTFFDALSKQNSAVVDDGAGMEEIALDAMTPTRMALTSDWQWFGWAAVLSVSGDVDRTWCSGDRCVFAPLMYYAKVRNSRAALGTSEQRGFQTHY
jgi:hypothetical protein